MRTVGQRDSDILILYFFNRGDMESETDRKLRLRLEAVRNDPRGWIDCGDYLEKFDPETRHVFRRKKPKASQTPHQDRFKSLKRGLER